MMKRYSQLVYRQTEPAQGSTDATETLITLHGHLRGIDDLLPLATSVGPYMRVFAPEAARGVYRVTQIIGRTWFGGTPERPEAASFGDSLSQLERFIHDVREQIGDVAARPWLLGYEQGAVLALSIAYIAPDLISGVMAISGDLPQFTTPGLLEPMEGNLPILLVGGGNEEEVSSTEKTADTLQDLGHRVTARHIDAASELGPDVGHELQTWFNQAR